ncbi:hypothetical protein PNOK_0297900 [Pyrrhoderma noxium]|uniref:Uncharacterized protein n=1 Tax=Pyrrhoderma noxium TaxID=2282107 RepID=A0A286ULA9_9AGAM|nr:hypothetical protein PNOK_0297900 [Pyrrhoderma noxium]
MRTFKYHLISSISFLVFQDLIHYIIEFACFGQHRSIWTKAHALKQRGRRFGTAKYVAFNPFNGREDQIMTTIDS